MGAFKNLRGKLVGKVHQTFIAYFSCDRKGMEA